jgi:hypothetical protein
VAYLDLGQCDSIHSLCSVSFAKFREGRKRRFLPSRKRRLNCIRDGIDEEPEARLVIEGLPFLNIVTHEL